ncbi:MAG: hypothetical protein ACI9DQ_001304, partial [Glaciecola sp.]
MKFVHYISYAILLSSLTLAQTASATWFSATGQAAISH